MRLPSNNRKVFIDARIEQFLTQEKRTHASIVGEAYAFWRCIRGNEEAGYALFAQNHEKKILYITRQIPTGDRLKDIRFRDLDELKSVSESMNLILDEFVRMVLSVRIWCLEMSFQGYTIQLCKDGYSPITLEIVT